MASRRVAIIAAVLLTALAAAGLYLGVNHVRRLEAHLGQLDERLVESEDRAARATARALQAEEAAREAAEEARQAEQQVRLAQRARIAAEDARVAAETDAEFARREAEIADQLAADARAEVERLEAERAREVGRLQDALGQIADTQRTALGLVMNLGEDAVNFDTDEAVIKPADRELLSRIAGVLLTAEGFRIQVFGHTDDVGSVEHNQGLSERRAQAVRDYLVDAGVSAAIITTKGFGKSNPLVGGTSDEARARNRRVEIGIIDTMVQYSVGKPRLR